MSLFDKDFRGFVLLSMSEVFAEARKFFSGVEYDRDKVERGLLDLCAIFGLDVTRPEALPPLEKDLDPRPLLNCMAYGRMLKGARRRFGYHDKCERLVRQAYQRDHPGSRKAFRTWERADSFPTIPVDKVKEKKPDGRKNRAKGKPR